MQHVEGKGVIENPLHLRPLKNEPLSISNLTHAKILVYISKEYRNSDLHEKRVTKVMRSINNYVFFPTYLRCWNPFGLAIHFFKLYICFWYKMYRRLAITVSGKLGYESSAYIR